MIGWCVSDQNHILASSRPSHGMSRRGGAAAIRPAMGLEYRTAVAAPSTIPEFFGGEPAARKKGRQEMPAKWSRPVFSFRFYEGKISHCPHCIRRLP
jgi:hypothetical protein